jgi:hypothetical protein
MPELMIFRTGKYPQGDWPKERVQRMVDAYDTEKNIDAPVVIGHRYYSADDDAQDAHGWVKGLRMDGAGKVFAYVPEFSADVKKKVVEGKLRYISAEIYEFDKLDAERPPYLKAIALLGRDTPAVPGTKITLFTLMAGGGLAVVDETEHVTAFTRKASAEEYRSLTEIHTDKEEPCMDEATLKAELAKKDAQVSAFKQELEALKAVERKKDAVAYFGKLRDEGKLFPGLFDQTVAFDTGLADEQRKAFRALFGELHQTVDLSGNHIADKTHAASATESTTLMAKIRAFQKEKHFASFEDAAGALYAEHPKLFEAGGVV